MRNNYDFSGCDIYKYVLQQNLNKITILLEHMKVGKNPEVIGLTAAEVAKLLFVSKEYVYKQLRNKKLKGLKKGRKWFINLVHLELFLSKRYFEIYMKRFYPSININTFKKTK